jgi:hypothetical protein
VFRSGNNIQYAYQSSLVSLDQSEHLCWPGQPNHDHECGYCIHGNGDWIVSARLLGPQARGELAAIQTGPTLIASLALLGMGEAAVSANALGQRLCALREPSPKIVVERSR